MPDRTVAPPFREIETFQLQIPVKDRLKNGVEFFYHAQPGLEVCKIDICFTGGRKAEKKAGLGNFTAGLLREGTSRYSSEEINSSLESYGSFIECNATSDQFVISVYSLVEKLGDVLILIRDMISDSIFPEEQLGKYKSSQISKLKINLEKTSFVAKRHILESIFGNKHPYGRVTIPGELESLQREEILEYFDAIVKNRQFTVFASGDLGDREIELINNYLGSLRAQPSDTITLPKSHFDATKYSEDWDQAVQSTIGLAGPVPGLHHPDTHRLSFTCDILGGYFGSRLMKNLREDKGYTYGMYSHLTHLVDGSYFFTTADVIKDKREEAIREVRKEIELLRTERVGDEELTTVKNYTIGSFLTSVNSSFSQIQLYRYIHLHGLPESHFESQIEIIKSITSDYILETARQYFDPASMVEVMVG